jgi:hypothetical protein
MAGCRATARSRCAQGIVMVTDVATRKLVGAIVSMVGLVKAVMSRLAVILHVVVMVNVPTALVFVLRDGTVCHVKVDHHGKQVPTIVENCITVINMVSVMKKATNVYVKSMQ